MVRAALGPGDPGVGRGGLGGDGRAPGADVLA